MSDNAVRRALSKAIYTTYAVNYGLAVPPVMAFTWTSTDFARDHLGAFVLFVTFSFFVYMGITVLLRRAFVGRAIAVVESERVPSETELSEAVRSALLFPQAMAMQFIANWTVFAYAVIFFPMHWFGLISAAEMWAILPILASNAVASVPVAYLQQARALRLFFQVPAVQRHVNRNGQVYRPNEFVAAVVVSTLCVAVYAGGSMMSGAVLTASRGLTLGENLGGFALLGLSGVVLTVIVCVSLLSTFRPSLSEIRQFLEGANARQGDLTQRVVVQSLDEIGNLGRQFNEFIAGLQALVGDVLETARKVAAAVEEVGTAASAIASGAEEVSAQSRSVASSAEQSSSSVEGISSSAEELSSTMTSMATAVEELSQSLGEVARHCTQQSGLASDAVQDSRAADEAISQMEEASRDIGGVVETISDIAAQTNLLALNATIEAASAGEAGKGFAVVAGEVKELSRQTAQATERIGQRFEAMDSSTKRVVEATRRIHSLIEQLDSIARSIATAVEQQSSTTRDIAGGITQSSNGATTIARSISEASRGLSEVSGNIQTVDKATNDSFSQLAAIGETTEALSAQARELARKVESFRV